MELVSFVDADLMETACLGMAAPFAAEVEEHTVGCCCSRGRKRKSHPLDHTAAGWGRG